jgi:rhodanese-related sulfurtransferase
MDLPGSIEVVDIRPAWQYEEFHIPGAVHAAVQDILTNPAYRADKRPLIIVCRDGSLSAAVGGALVDKSPRPIRFLSGGVTRYYDEIMRPAGILSDKMTGVAPALPQTPARAPKVMPERAPATPAPAPPPAKPQKKKKSAGC